MRLAALIAAGRSAQASDLHLEPGLPASLRVRGQLRSVGEPIPAAELLAMARELVGEERWPEFLERRSCDLSRTVAGARLRIGELRDPQTMRLTLNAAETGHLVLTTLHSSSCAEALQRIVSAFPAEIQSGICAQLADCLVGVVCQRMRFIESHGLRAPECEVLLGTQSVRAIVRQGQFFKLRTALETGGNDGLFTFARYREWMEKRTDWQTATPETGPDEVPAAEDHLPPPRKRGKEPGTVVGSEGAVEIGPGDEDLARILSELEDK